MAEEQDSFPTEASLSLSALAANVALQLGRLGLDAGEGYLQSVKQLVDPLQARIDAARDRLWDLMTRAALVDNTRELRIVNDLVVDLSCELFGALHSVPMVQELCTLARTAIVERALELSRRKLYFSGTYCDLPLALFSVGSDGRREQFLYPDQDFLFLYGVPERGEEISEEQIEDFFGMLGGVFMTKLEEAGIERCSGGIMPVNEEWRGTLPQWQQRLDNTFRFERGDWQKNVLNLIALMDARFICGDRSLAQGFAEMVRSRAREDAQAMFQMARVVSAMRLSKGFLRWFVVEAEGEHKGEFNLKLLAWTPLVMCVRLLAVYFAIEETSTVERIRLLRTGGCFTDRMAEDLTDAYHVISQLRVLQQTKRRKRIVDDDCYINPYELPNPDREALRKAIGSIEELQSLIRIRFWVSSEVERKVPTLSVR
jgi:signal-transduction protein with cAMP-binding, CBS, and nucleotidyltransferase domain